VSDAELAGALLAIDPGGLGGAILRGPGRPDRDAWLDSLHALLPSGAPVRRLPPRIDDDRLLGGLDFSASLAAGRGVVQRGVLAEADGGIVVIPMAERLEPALAARLCGVLDTGEVRLERDGLTHRANAQIALVALDEGADDSEAAPQPLADRVAFHLGVGAWAMDPAFDADTPSVDGVVAARRRLTAMDAPGAEVVEALCAVAVQIGVTSLRAPVFALKAAMAHAALRGRFTVGLEDAAAAARLVLAPRARVRPLDEAEGSPPPPANADTPRPDSIEEAPASGESPADVVVAAVRSALPPGVLDGSATAPPSASVARSRGAGAQARSASRGRPAGVRAARLGSGARLNLVETLRAAAPWQGLRRLGTPDVAIQVRGEDFRVQKYVQRRESTTIFAVDASGSTAVQRLAEAKGAVELLLAKAYVSRARVALIAFRGQEAELMLPPTRSLARARARLAALPGGGGTPLASALDTALAVALAERKRGATPQIVLLTDGRANIARGGLAGRAAAEADANAAARAIGEARIASVFVDTAPRPGPDAARFARAMAGAYYHLPFVDARALADAVGAPREPRR
jgi:magnesium chelatase subunit D